MNKHDIEAELDKAYLEGYNAGWADAEKSFDEVIADAKETLGVE